jgi:Prokaryotic membrane lipoprotein lipid attachment site
VKRFLSTFFLILFLSGCQTVANVLYNPNSPSLVDDASRTVFLGASGSAWQPVRFEIVRSDSKATAPTPANDPEARLRVTILKIP